MLWGLSPHSLRGAPGHCSTLPPRFAGSGNQGSENRFREPGFGARFREPRVPGTRVRGKVPGTQGSANQTFKQGSGNNGFWIPFGFRDVKVPGRFRAHLAFDKVPGTLPWFRAARAWIVPKFWNHRNTNFETSCKPRVWGTRILARFQQHWVPTRFREPPQMRTHSLDILPGLCHRFRTGTRSEFWQGSEVPETTQGSDIRRGLYQGSCYGQGPRKPICKETKVPGPKGPGQRAIADRGGQRDNKSARLSSGNPGFQYTLWVAPRFRKRGFQEDKVPGTQGSRNTRDSGNPPANLGCFVAPHWIPNSCSFAQWAHSVGRLTCSDAAVKSSVWTVPMSHLPKHMPHQAIKFDALEHLNIGSKPVWGFSKPGRWFFEAKWPNSNTQWNFRHSCDTTTKYWHETNSGIMMDNLAKTNCFTNHLRKLTDVVQARQDNPKPTHTHTIL